MKSSTFVFLVFQGGQGAILFSIVGGKMSEGINFSDELARCVCVVGLPYPNIGSADMIEKMRYLDSLKFSSNNNGETAGRAYYENTCWKAINQSIGRAIRHRADYATLVLIDKRYTRTNIPSKLPHWLAKSFYQMKNFSETSQAIEKVKKKTMNRFVFIDFILVFSLSTSLTLLLVKIQLNKQKKKTLLHFRLNFDLMFSSKVRISLLPCRLNDPCDQQVENLLTHPSKLFL